MAIPAEFYEYIPGRYAIALKVYSCLKTDSPKRFQYYNFTTGEHSLILENSIVKNTGYNNINAVKLLTPEGFVYIHVANLKNQFIAVGPSQKLAGKTFCMTGEHVHFSRAVVEKLIQIHGGEVKSAITNGLSYLLQGSAVNKGGSKLAKAQKLGIPVIHEDDLYNLIA